MSETQDKILCQGGLLWYVGVSSLTIAESTTSFLVASIPRFGLVPDAAWS